MTQEQKDVILKQYLKWVNQACEDLPEKTHFTPEEIVMKVLSLAEEYFE